MPVNPAMPTPPQPSPDRPAEVLGRDRGEYPETSTHEPTLVPRSDAASPAPLRPEKLVYTKEELAELLGIAPRTLQTMTRGGKIPCIRTAGRGGRVLYPKAKVEDWLSKQAERNCR